MLGESGKDLVYYQLKNSYGLGKQIFRKNQNFLPNAYTAFSDLGTKIIGATILKNYALS